MKNVDVTVRVCGTYAAFIRGSSQMMKSYIGTSGQQEGEIGFKMQQLQLKNMHTKIDEKQTFYVDNR